jgi:hypothetical protein
VQGRLTITIQRIRIRSVPQEQSGNFEVATPYRIVQRCVGLRVVTLHACPSTCTEQQLHSLESIGTSDKTRSGHRKLQRKLAAPFIGASGIRLSAALQKQSHCIDICLADCLMQSMLPISTRMTPLQSIPEKSY